MHHSDGLSLWAVTTLIFFAVIIAKLIAKKTKTVDVLWLILFGSLFGNLGFIPEESKPLEYIGEIGIIFIMFALGFEESVENFVKGLKKAIGIATIGAIFPFFAGYIVAITLGYDHNHAMLWGLTMTATAVSLTMMSLKNQNMHKTTAATGIMTAAVVDDVLSLIGVAILIPLILSGDSASFSSVGFIALKVIVFFAIVIFIGLVVFPDKTKESSGFIRYFSSFLHKKLEIRRLLLIYQGEFTPLVMVFLAISIGALAFEFGFHPAIGAYFAGLFLKEEYFVIKDSNVDYYEKNKRYIEKFIDNIAFVIFGPIFFVNLGSKLIFDLDILSNVLLPSIILFIVVLVFQVLSAGFAARYTGNYSKEDSVLIGLGMLGRAELAFIVINIAYVQNKIIDINQFYILVFTTFLLNISVPILIKWWRPYYNGEKEFKVFNIILSKNNKG